MAYPVLGPFSLHLGSVLISEGTSDIIFAIQNAGNITASSYWSHKKWSILISISCAGIGAWLSRGASVANVAASVAEQEVATVVVSQAAKSGSRALIKAIFKKVLGEVAKALLGLAQSFLSNAFSKLVVDAIFHEFRDTIVAKIQSNAEYKQKKESLSSNLEKLEILLDKPRTQAVLNEKFDETERDQHDNLNNSILSLTGQAAGPLAGQIGEAAQNTQYSGLQIDAQSGKLSNSQSKRLGQIAQGISLAMKVLGMLNAAYELVTIVSDLVNSIDRKIKYKVSAEEKSGQKSKEAKKARYILSQFWLLLPQTLLERQL